LRRPWETLIYSHRHSRAGGNPVVDTVFPVNLQPEGLQIKECGALAPNLTLLDSRFRGNDGLFSVSLVGAESGLSDFRVFGSRFKTSTRRALPTSSGASS
jgi:hypothetical protein